MDTGEIPNVILYVEEMTAEGFIGTVTDYGVTDHLGLGTRLNVVIGDGMRSNADIIKFHRNVFTLLDWEKRSGKY